MKAAERTLADAGKGMHPLLAAAHAMPTWLDAGGIRPAIRTAIVRLWTREKLTRLPLPLTGAAALKPEERWDEDPWTHRFLQALGEEAADWLQLLTDMERAWLRARAQVSDRRRNSRAAMAVDMLAAAPIASASTLAVGLDMAVQNVSALLQDFCRANIADRSHASVEAQALQPRQPRTCQGPGCTAAAPRTRSRPRPPADLQHEEDLPPEPVPPPPVSMIERRAFDYSDLEHWMDHLDRDHRENEAKPRHPDPVTVAPLAITSRQNPTCLMPLAGAHNASGSRAITWI